MRNFLFGCILLLWCAGIYAQPVAVEQEKGDYLNTSLDFETRAKDLVMHMTLEEKINQLGDKAPAIPRLGINKYDWWNECLHGVARAGEATVFPQAIGMAASFDRKTMKEVATIISDEARAKHHEAMRNEHFARYRGLTFWSPNVNIFRDPRWGRGHETYGEDPYLTGQMGIEFVEGLQGDDEKYLKLVATAKHFAVHNGPEADRHVFNVTPSSRDLWETYLPAFYDLIVTGQAYSVMGAYNRVDGESSCASWMLLEDILRQKWDFDGYVVSDCGAILDIWKHHKVVNTPAEAAAVGVRRGCDLNCGSVYAKHMAEAIRNGLISEGEVDLAVYRLMLARMKLGMFDPAEMVPYAQISTDVNNCAKHDAKALDMAHKSMTLLKNDGLLPLDKNKIKTIAVIGPNADSEIVLRANYFGDASAPVTVLSGIKKALGKKVNVLYDECCPISGEIIKGNFKVIDPKYLSTKNSQGKRVKGLEVQFFEGQDFAGEPILTRIDEKIDMDWGGGSPTTTAVAQGILSPDQKVADNLFCGRWKGQLKAPKTGTYTLALKSDDGSRLYVDGKEIVSGWDNQGMELVHGDIEMVAGKSYDIVIEYFEVFGACGIQLLWDMPSNKKFDAENPMAATLALVEQADLTIFVGGLNANWEGEEMANKAEQEGFYKGDRTKIELPRVQREVIKAIQETGKPMAVVLLSGSAMAFDGLEKDMSALLMGWYPGQRGGDAVADVLFGDYNPAGRLPVTFYEKTEDLAEFTDYNMSAGQGQTYRYFKGETLFPFGHGLSYTTFEYSDLKLDKTTINDTDEIKVTFNVKNTGDYHGEEVVQLYIRDVESDKVMPLKQLRNFERISLKKGKEQMVSFTVNAANDLRYYDAFEKMYSVEPGAFEIQVGASSEDIRLSAEIIVE